MPFTQPAWLRATATTDRPACESSTAPTTAGLYYAAFLLDPDGNNVEAVVREF